MDVVVNPTQGVMNYNYMYEPFSNPWVIGVMLGVAVIFIVIFGNLGAMGEQQIGENKGTKTLEIILWALLIFLLITVGIKQVFGIEYAASVKNLLTAKPEVDMTLTSKKPPKTTVPEIRDSPQVFNIPGNHYNYDNAKALCKAYGAKLASYDQIEKSYNKGGEWCNFGWSANQLALYPTQKDTYDKLQDIKGHEHDCGRPGINGGFIDNPNVKFGVNCFGYKPQATAEEKELLSEGQIYPKTKEDMEMHKRVKFWKKRLDKILVSPFNYNTWAKV